MDVNATLTGGLACSVVVSSLLENDRDVKVLSSRTVSHTSLRMQRGLLSDEYVVLGALDGLAAAAVASLRYSL